MFFDEPTAKKLLIDIEFQKKTIEHQDKQISVLNEQNVNLFNLSEQYKLKSDGLQKDKEIQTERANLFESKFTETSKKLLECKSESPSRLTWFGIGFVTAVILGTAAAFAIAK